MRQAFKDTVKSNKTTEILNTSLSLSLIVFAQSQMENHNGFVGGEIKGGKDEDE